MRPLERFLKAIVEVRQLLSEPEFLAAISGRLKEPISLHKRRQLGLNDKPFLLVVGRLSDVIAICRLMAQFDRLPQRNVDIILSEVIEVVSRRTRVCSGPVPNVPFGTNVIGR